MRASFYLAMLRRASFWPCMVAVATAGLHAAEPTDTQKTLHVLNRLGYGPKPGDLDKIKATGVRAYIEQQLSPERIPDPVVEAKLAAYTTLKMTLQQYEDATPPVAPEGRRYRVQNLPAPGEMAKRDGTRERYIPIETAREGRPGESEYIKARLIRGVYSERQLQEVMVDFWMNHFSIRMRDEMMATDFEYRAIRPHVLGKFEDMLKATARHPAMLQYLDNWKSSAPAEVLKARMSALQPDLSGEERRQFRRRTSLFADFKGLNENYARELMELHTLGVDGGYTQQDVIQVAKCFTGWTITEFNELGARTAESFLFEPLMHESGSKTVLGKTIKEGGIEEGVQVLEMLARHPSTAKYIATKLSRRFFADDPPARVVDLGAAAFLKSKGDIREVLRAVLTSEEFLAPQYYQTKIKKPIEFVISALRASNAELSFPPGAVQSRRRAGSRSLLKYMADMGETLYQRVTPDGYPDTASAWMNTNSLLKRMEFARVLSSNELATVGAKADVASAARLAQQIGLPAPTAAQVEKIREQARQAASAAAAAGDMNMMAAGGMMNSGGVAKGFAAEELSPEAVAVAFALGSPQFQKR